jgi:hypothetical protein
MDLIIGLVKAVEEDDTIRITRDIYDHSHPLVNAIIYLANTYLTLDDRHEHLRVLKQHGIEVFPGEQDRFGWLTGCIQLSRGQIVFG